MNLTFYLFTVIIIIITIIYYYHYGSLWISRQSSIIFLCSALAGEEENASWHEHYIFVILSFENHIPLKQFTRAITSFAIL